MRCVLRSLFLTFSLVLPLTFAAQAPLMLAVTSPAWAFAADEPLEDPALEARAHELFKQLRCLVCQNQSIEDSGADLALDLRAVVREQLLAGQTDAEIRQFMVVRYGDWVLMEPPLGTRTFLLWGLPIIMAVFALSVGGWAVMRRARAIEAEGTDQREETELESMRERLAAYQVQEQKDKS